MVLLGTSLPIRELPLRLQSPIYPSIHLSLIHKTRAVPSLRQPDVPVPDPDPTSMDTSLLPILRILITPQSVRPSTDPAYRYQYPIPICREVIRRTNHQRVEHTPYLVYTRSSTPNLALPVPQQFPPLNQLHFEPTRAYTRASEE